MSETGPDLGAKATHFTLRVTDMARSERFYEQALGFSVDYRTQAPAAFAALLTGETAEGLAVTALSNAGLRIELAQVLGAGPAAPGEGGWRHIGLRVRDLAATLARVEANGGRAVGEARLENERGLFQVCEDPDGARLLLIQPAV